LNEFQKWLLQAMGRRHFAPRPFGKKPTFTLADHFPNAGDTGGGGWYRPPHRKQDPSVDPREPYGSDSSGTGNDHGWSNCTMASAAMAMAGATEGKALMWGGDMRHRQSDMTGGTDLYDAREAFNNNGESLYVHTGAGWNAMLADYDEGRYLIVQGEGNLPGAATFDGAHACVISPERRSNDDFLFGDPLANGWQWVTRSSVKSWMNAFHSGYAWAATDAVSEGEVPLVKYTVPDTEVSGILTTTRECEAIPITGGDRPILSAGLERPCMGVVTLDDLDDRPCYMMFVGTEISFVAVADVDFRECTVPTTPDTSARDLEWVTALSKDWPVQIVEP